MKILGKKISDDKFKGLIGRFMKGDLVSHDGEAVPSEIGTPQGSIMSPILANIYLNEVVDQWFLTNYASYNNVIVRYADDAVFFFKKENDAESFLKELTVRIENFGLKLNADKTHIRSLRKEESNSFNFLGFTFYWGRRQKRRELKVKTQKGKLIRALQEFEIWIKNIRNRVKLSIIWRLAQAKIRGHINYYGYAMNNLKLHHFYSETTRLLYKWLNRRSQKRSYNWEGFTERINNFPLMKSWEALSLKQLGRRYVN